jgi:aryl-alcohol dehydrogenase-like predicted oxidoreductase
MKLTKLKKSDLEISEIIMGCWGIGGGYTWGDQDEKISIDTLRTALDSGITTFDTAEFYSNGYSEELVGKALKGRRNESVIATKIWVDNMAVDKVEDACKGCLDRLQTDHIDLFQIHWPHPEVPMDETLKAMDALKSKGMVREIGVCNFGAGDLGTALESASIVSNQLSYSLLFRAVEFDLLDDCMKKDIDVFAYSPLSQGLLTGKFRKAEDVSDERARIRFYSEDRPGTVHQEPGYEDLLFSALDEAVKICDEAGVSLIEGGLQWLMNKNEISAILVGARTPEQVKGNISAAAKTVSPDVLEALDKTSQKLKAAMGSNADMWRTESRVK